MSDTAFTPHTAIHPDGTVAFGDDSKLNVRFFRGTEIHGMQSIEQGRPVTVGVDMIGLRQPGERDEHHGRVTEIHKQRFPRQWQAYVEGREHVPDGTPLDVLFPTEPETVENLRSLKVYTVEQLAELQENAIARLGMGSRDLVTKAQKFMAAATNYQAANKMNKELEDVKAEKALLEQRVAAMERLLNAEPPTRRARKEAQDDPHQ